MKTKPKPKPAPSNGRDEAGRFRRGQAPKPKPTPTLVVERVNLHTLHEDPSNPNTHPENDIRDLMAKLSTFPQVEPLVIQKSTRKVIGGNGRLEAMRRLGWVQCDVTFVDVDNVTATALGISLNRRKSLFDDSVLVAQLQAIQSENADLMDAVGYDQTEIDALIAGLKADITPAEDPGSTATGPKVFSDEQIIEAAFQWFRKTGFPYRNLPAWECMKEVNKLAGSDELFETKTAYHVGDTYHPQRWHAGADGQRSPFDAFSDDKLLRESIRQSLEFARPVLDQIKHVHGTQSCSNFRPGFACKIYREFCQAGDTVLDTSTGYGGRLVGFMASGIAGLYIGIDPSTKTHAGNLRMAEELGFSDKVELINQPAEDVQRAELAGRCDFAFTSPPYFSKEHYSDEPTQSWKRYSTGDSWREMFLGPMFALQFEALKPGKFSVVNIADVKIGGKTYPLLAWAMKMALEAGFKHVRTEEFPMQKRFGAGHDDEVATEPVLVFQKPAISL